MRPAWRQDHFPLVVYTAGALFDAAVQLTHMCHTAKERGDREALADYRARRNLVRAELLRRCDPVSVTVGSVWEWEPLKPHARERVTVTAVGPSGVESVNTAGRRCWNTLDRWFEAAVLVAPREA